MPDQYVANPQEPNPTLVGFDLSHAECIKKARSLRRRQCLPAKRDRRQRPFRIVCSFQ
ncbi:MAG: hypothetical protein JWQ23_4457 [Herminiimonas sp.]|nr:hypothetical protein [Herminiimonas sp.]